MHKIINKPRFLLTTNLFRASGKKARVFWTHNAEKYDKRADTTFKTQKRGVYLSNVGGRHDGNRADHKLFFATAMNHLLFLGNLGWGEILIIALVVLLLFGGRKIPELMRGIGKGVRSFKEGMNGVEEPKTEKEPDEKQ